MLSIILSYYKNPANLRVILSALAQQSVQDFELILSEDDHNPATASLLKGYPFPIQHLYQAEDKGFRKNLMLNRSVRAAHFERLAFIDGDCVPHRHFVKEYAKMQRGFYYAGRAVMLGPKISEGILAREQFQAPSLWRLYLSKSRKQKEGLYFPLLVIGPKNRGLVGRNWGICKSDLEKINGFDLDYEGPGVGEDTDVEWRLIKAGLEKRSMKNKAIIYHLYHPRSYSQDPVKHNFQLMQEKKKAGQHFCLRGLQQTPNS